MNCLFCKSNGPFTTKEHIIPESLGNDDLILKDHVCDTCQAYFGKEIEKYVLSRTPIGFWRVFLSTRTKDDKLPSIDLSISEKDKGILPQWSSSHDNKVGFTSHEDWSTSVDIDDSEIVKEIISGERTRFQFVLSPKHLEQIGRFLGKIAIEILCTKDSDFARSDIFDELRFYVRRGIRKEIWPIFHGIKGNIDELIKIRAKNKELFEDVLLYEYGIHEVKQYWLFSLRLGTDLWVICMNDPCPTPIIRSAYPNLELQLLWYPRDSWRKV